jgi:biotin carboxylase
MGWESGKIFKIGSVKKKLAIIGASYLQVPLVKKAKTMGLETHVFAWEQGAAAKEMADFFYPVSILDRDTILNFCNKIKPHGIVSIASDIAMHTVNSIAQELDLIGNDLECTIATTDKYVMRSTLSANKIRCPGFIFVQKLSDIHLEDLAKLKFPVIVKPTDRSGSRGVTKVNSLEFLEDAVNRAVTESLSATAIVEEFVNGKEFSIEMITWRHNHHFLAVTEKVTTGSPYFVEIEQHEPAQVTDEVKNAMISLTIKALNALGVTYGASHSEIIVDENNELFIVEIGARMGGDNIGACLVEMSTGYDFVKGVIEVSMGTEPIVKRTWNKFAGIYYLTPPAGRVRNICINPMFKPQIKGYEIFVKMNDEVNYPVRDSSRRSGYIMYQSDLPFKITNLSEIVNIQVE